MYRSKPPGVKLRQTDPYKSLNHNVRALVFAATRDPSPPHAQMKVLLEEYGVLRVWYHETQPAFTLQVHARDEEHFNKILLKLSEVLVVVDVRVVVSEPIDRKGWRFDDVLFEEMDEPDTELAAKMRALYGS